ncbi:PREDICTED: glycine N-acyltransferase-like protein 3 [Gekko japonicus]|uniref:Glycine N-acyltransferase-like protein n=1 Tax=Gekko japonicus TaxID=146911 RepID=A0ABM1LDN4_GEKJA|nr:PREDICTED: glycine N-acyltransferase-like protein 3 [Gekko japonicus]
MLILSCPSKLQLLEGILRKCLPQTLSVHGAVMHINRGNPAGHEVLVDSWPKFKAVLTRPCREVSKDDSDFYTNMYAAFYHDLDAYRTLLQDSDAINWAQTFYILGNRQLPTGKGDRKTQQQFSCAILNVQPLAFQDIHIL